ncbi:hypothetical protein SAMN05660649_00753 [Desulfotomaculum arcticum]|uniref:Uncharacterized protein n=1 Tax=Desulfotruncus arcticus DSM 17038 TaxID=1121424 RepID=A0A1I2P7D2_9FIRM|nr:hypothetical protein [Desulfotruncus arcticus]SFG12028.1 hypothetical protein SAMN05660649_00753 [Desulfotomaculum arcticum] [Desulfotruncus arcticus DSM 17038]
MAGAYFFGLPTVTWVMIILPFAAFWFLPLVLAKIILSKRQETEID